MAGPDVEGECPSPYHITDHLVKWGPSSISSMGFEQVKDI